MSKLMAAMFVPLGLLAIALLALAQDNEPLAAVDGPLQLLQRLDEYPHAVRAAFSEGKVIDHEVGLGAIKKVRGVWQFKDSERLSGTLTRYTWQIIDGFTSLEVMQELVAQLQQREGVELLFECQGRACGHGSQWANRVFRQRVLYGREDLQQYAVYSLDSGRYRMVIYSSARTADRQYLHVDLLAQRETD